MENQSNQGILAQAKEFVTETFEAAKGVIGLGNEHPQAKVEHEQPYLDDIAKGKVKSLHHVETVEPTLDKVLGEDASKIKIKKIDKKPLLNEIKEGVPLSHVETKDKAKPVIEKDIKIKEIGKEHKNLLNAVEEFDKDSLKDVKTKDKSVPKVAGDAKLKIVPEPSTLEKTKEFVTEKYDNAKKNVDAQVEHTKEKVHETKEAVAPKVEETKKYVSEKLHDAKEAVIPKVEQTKEYVSEKLHEAKEAVVPKVEETKKYVKENIPKAKEYVAEKVQDAKEATGLAPEHPQSKVEHEQPFLNDIAKGNIEPLHHVKPVEKDLTATLGEDLSKVHIKKIDRKPLLNEIKEGVPLASVETEDKAKPFIEEGITIKKIGKEREKLLDEVTVFEKDSKLKHVKTDDKSGPLLSGKQ